ncbi:FAD-dependent oxidoreductase [Massilia psychrophila]|uniref:Pyridine nucleotide-disulfide oxidoreductase n=1 Tax=Massilia psychrophila TaxID=1603353 RepID=A0A2G8SWB8_9BURK|nr:FAD-dependent oxidoreductase [Massilia psychrophila]PIL38096.1 pyridine nucleotide-disulfide oxidoreductase [Massilia psychrophila]GGE88157.1 pyridine nucleotide-disulfide oxidoreductase [Massilia psychrophila]
MKKLILVGAGHAHARVLLDMSQRARAEVDVLLVNPAPLAPYSGMVPGWLAGHYDWEACCIDFARLCQRSGARLRLGAVRLIDPDKRVLWLDSGQQFEYDVLSIDIGSTAFPPDTAGLPVMPLRPLGALEARWEDLRGRVAGLPFDAEFTVVVVGGGAAGVETALAARRQLALWAPHVRFTFILGTRSDTLLAALADGASRKIATHLRKNGIRVAHRFVATRFDTDAVVSLDGRRLAADLALWAGGAQAHSLPAVSKLACDADGFIRVDNYLRSVSHPDIFAAGDCASLAPALPKAGVFAVRMGPVLAHNLRAHLLGVPLRPYLAQRRHLVLLGTGGEHAVASWGPFAWQGKWVWQWKKWIDLRFLKQYNRTDTE